MASKKILNAVLGSAMVLAAVTATMALPRIAESPAALYVAGQVQMAVGNTANGMKLMNRAAQKTQTPEAPAAKPSPARPEMNCNLKPKQHAVRTVQPKVMAKMEVPATPMVRPAAHAVPMAPVAVGPIVVRVGSLAPNSRDIERQVRIIQRRMNGKMMKQLVIG